MAVTIRPYREQDQAQLLQSGKELQQYEYELSRWMADPDAIAGRLRDNMLDEHSRGKLQILVAETGETVIGYVSFYPDLQSEDLDEIPHRYAYISDLSVLPGQRGRGIGRQLLQAAEHALQESGAAVIRIQVLAGNDGAAQLYRTSGYSDLVITLEKDLQG